MTRPSAVTVCWEIAVARPRMKLTFRTKQTSTRTALMAVMTPKIMIVASKIPPDQILRYQPPPRAEEKRLHRPVRATRRASLDRRRWQGAVSESEEEPLLPRLGQVATYPKATLQAMPSRESTQTHATQPKATQPHTTQAGAKPVRKRRCRAPDSRKGNRHAMCDLCDKRSDACICDHRPPHKKKKMATCPHGKATRSACKDCGRVTRHKRGAHAKCPHGTDMRSACKDCGRGTRPRAPTKK